MQNCKTSAGTDAQKSSKYSLLLRLPLLLAIPMLCAVYSATGQSGLINKDSIIKSGIGNIANRPLLANKLYIQNDFISATIDTVACLFLEITDTTTTSTKWTKGYVVRRNGFIKFGEKTEVGERYLPITSGIIKSELMYEDRCKVINKALQIILVK